MSAGRSINSLSQHWATPLKYTEPIREFFDNEIDLDPCSNSHSIVKARVEYILPVDGLKESWDFAKIFVNPPYGRDPERKTTIKQWLQRCAEAAQKGSEIIALVPVATNTSHWKRFVFGSAAAICFLGDTRLKFRVNGHESNKGAPMACCLIYWGKNIESFAKKFCGFGFIVQI